MAEADREPHACAGGMPRLPFGRRPLPSSARRRRRTARGQGRMQAVAPDRPVSNDPAHVPTDSSRAITHG
ncbi:hypothetical protein WI41_21530 [Burkholderia latens]|uniref:Uncharacterized protein n=1 Tax=Burkholderia latens TaxID=488446 RepID=A0AAP1C1X7_9BURK|nr:hypothetical protein WI41_21530 [Burkholderia latens]